MRISVIGAGAIGITHCATLEREKDFAIAGVADPSPQGAEVAAKHGAAHYKSHLELIEKEKPEGAIIATPNELHVSIGIDFMKAGIPILMEKPIANTVEEGMELIKASEETGVPILVGHHRRHHPFIKKAKEIISQGGLGRIVMVNVNYCLMKPQSYFEAAWRLRPGVGGPLLINAIHEVDLLRHLFGEIASVSALSSSAVRGHDVEDTGAVIFQFESGALGVMSVSDTAAGPWSWDLASGDVPRFPRHLVNSHMISGTEASLTLPKLELWRHEGERSWNNLMKMEEVACQIADPFIAQLHHFRDVVKGKASPLVSASEATRNIAAMSAIFSSIRSGKVAEVKPV